MTPSAFAMQPKLNEQALINTNSYRRVCITISCRLDKSGKARSISIECDHGIYSQFAQISATMSRFKKVTFHARGGITYLLEHGIGDEKRNHRYRNATDYTTLSRFYPQMFAAVDYIFKNVEAQPSILRELRERHPQMPYWMLLWTFACPYSQMVMPKDGWCAALAFTPELYTKPQVRKACQNKDFKQFILHHVGNVTKPVMRAAGEASVCYRTFKRMPDVPLTVRQEFTGTISSPVVFDKYLFNDLVHILKVPLEKAAHITKQASIRSSNVLSRAVVSGAFSTRLEDPLSETIFERYISPLFSLIGEKQAINYLTSIDHNGFDDLYKYIIDAHRMYITYCNPNNITTTKAKLLYPNGLRLKKSWKTIKELHDDLSRHYTKISALENRKIIPWPAELKTLHGQKIDNIRIFLPRTTATVARWGADQKHCIASYATRMMESKCVLFGVFVDSKLKYCGRLIKDVQLEFDQNGATGTTYELGSYSLAELRSANNKTVDPEHLFTIYQILMQFNVEDLYPGKW